MRNLFLMSLFGLFMMASANDHAPFYLTLSTDVFANTDLEKAAKAAEEKAKISQQDAELAQTAATDAEQKYLEADKTAKKLGTKEAKKAAEVAKEAAKQAEKELKAASEKAKTDAKGAKEAMQLTAFHCPAGIASCYRSDGTEYTDVNNLEATASGEEGEGNDSVAVVKPSHLRSF